MPDALAELLQTCVFDEKEIAARSQRIYETILANSSTIDQGNFRAISGRDVQQAFEQYDAAYFDGLLRSALDASPIQFRVSSRMTSAGGKTIRRTPRSGGPPRYEIAISSALLFETFRGQTREITVNGLVCRDRLEALLRVMEHELVHLSEMLVWDRSSCAAARFQSIARRLFGHTEAAHGLITRRETAYVEHGIHPGARVRFHYDGRVYVGLVNRITKRATVLVEDPAGQPFSDGKRYATFYVPVPHLELVEGHASPVA